MRQKNVAIKIKEGLLVKKVGDELVILGPDDKTIFMLNETAAMIWDLLKKGKNLEDIALCLVEEYEIDKDAAKKEAHAFLENIKKYHELLVV